MRSERSREKFDNLFEYYCRRLCKNNVVVQYVCNFLFGTKIRIDITTNHLHPSTVAEGVIFSPGYPDIYIYIHIDSSIILANKAVHLFNVYFMRKRLRY